MFNCPEAVLRLRRVHTLKQRTWTSLSVDSTERSDSRSPQNKIIQSSPPNAALHAATRQSPAINLKG